MFKSKVPYAEKVEIVRDHLEGRKGYTENLRQANNSDSSILYRVHQYQGKGIEGLLPSCKKHK